MPAYSVENVSDSERDIWEGEWKKDFSVDQAVLPALVNQRGIDTGFGTVNFTVVTDDGVARQRSRNGEMPYRNGAQNIVSADLEEAADGIRIPSFAAFKSSVDQRAIAMAQVSGTIKRAQNSKVISILAGFTAAFQNNAGSAAAFNAANVDNQLAIFRTRTKGSEGRMIGLLTEHAHLEYERQNTVSSRDYTDTLKLPSGRKSFSHRGVEWIPFPDLTGAGTATAKCYLFMSDAIEYFAKDEGFIADYDKQHRRHYCNALVYQAGVIALPKGVVHWVHDDTAVFT